MKNLLTLIATAALALSFTAAHAADDAKTKQQNKMASCSADFKATGKDGKERQAFMKECLSAKPTAAKPAAPAPGTMAAAPAPAPAAPKK